MADFFKKVCRFLRLRMFWRCLLGSWLGYFVLLLLVNGFQLYEWFPGIGFLGYAIVIALQLLSINYGQRRLDYIVISFSLVVIGAIASLDMIMHKQQMADLWVSWGWLTLTAEHIDGYLQILIILLNIFTGSVAAQSLFYGLNKRSF